MNTTGTLTALIVDDSVIIRTLVTKILSKLGFSITTANDGFEALAQIVHYPPDIIFLDVTMPKVNGYQACEIIKNNPDYKNIPLVFLTSHDGLFEKVKGKVTGCDGYLTKPFTQEELIDFIKNLETESYVFST